MLETSARLLRLLSLLQTPREWAGAELAARLGVDVRTVRRDIDWTSATPATAPRRYCSTSPWADWSWST